MVERVLLDTHVFVWAVYAPEQLGESARRAISEAEAVHVSTVSLWELAIKHRVGKFVHDPAEIIDELAAFGADELPILHQHLRELTAIELPHRDPFDALLVAQATSTDAVLVTADRVLLASPYATRDARE